MTVGTLRTEGGKSIVTLAVRCLVFTSLEASQVIDMEEGEKRTALALTSLHGEEKMRGRPMGRQHEGVESCV